MLYVYCNKSLEQNPSSEPNFFVVKGPAADATDAPQPSGLLCNRVMKMISFFSFPCNGAPVEWEWQGKTEILGETPIPVPRCLPQIPHGPIRDRTRASEVRGQRLTAWAMARPNLIFAHVLNKFLAFYGTRNVFLPPDEPTIGLVRATQVPKVPL
jgi:hypothetical protein